MIFGLLFFFSKFVSFLFWPGWSWQHNFYSLFKKIWLLFALQTKVSIGDTYDLIGPPKPRIRFSAHVMQNIKPTDGKNPKLGITSADTN